MTYKPFPPERVNNFSDAIFGIAITLLVLEIKVPTVEEIKQVGVANVLIKRIPNFIGYFVSFMVTALYWRGHLRLFQWVKTIDSKLLWLNLGLLFFVVLLPFSTALYSYYGNNKLVFIVYHANLAAIGVMSYWMMAYVVTKENLTTEVGVINARWMKNKMLVSPVVFVLCIPLAFLSPIIARLAFFSIFIFQAIGERFMKRKLQGETTLHITPEASHPDH